MTFGWANPFLVQARDRSTTVDPRLAGMDYATNGSPATFYVDLPAPGTYSLSLAMGDAGFGQCGTQCQIQFLDGNTVVGTLTKGPTAQGFFYDATGANWSAAAWPGSNIPMLVTMTGTRLTVLLGTNNNTGDLTPIAFLGVAQAAGTELQHLGFAHCDDGGAGESGDVDHHLGDQWRLQQFDRALGLGRPERHNHQLQSQPDCGAGWGHFHHDHQRGQRHADGNLSHYRDRQWRRFTANRHGHPDGGNA